jgi:hypothetical protein
LIQAPKLYSEASMILVGEKAHWIQESL